MVALKVVLRGCAEVPKTREYTVADARLSAPWPYTLKLGNLKYAVLPDMPGSNGALKRD